MNGRYLILPNFRYVDGYIEWDRALVDETNNVIMKKWKHLDSFSDMLFVDKSEDDIWIMEWFADLWDLTEEKGEFFAFETRDHEKYYFYNAIDDIEAFEWNKIPFIEILFEDRKEIIEEKLWSYLNYVYWNNVSKIKNLANTATIKSKTELIQNIGNEGFLSVLWNIDKILLKELFFLSQKNFYGWKWHTNLYVFREEEGRLRPVRFDGDFKSPILSEQVFDKVEVLIAFQGKKKINLFFEKLMYKTLFLKKEFITKSDLQNFYNFYFKT